jgi:hypothetical protein
MTNEISDIHVTEPYFEGILIIGTQESNLVIPKEDPLRGEKRTIYGVVRIPPLDPLKELKNKADKYLREKAKIMKKIPELKEGLIRLTEKMKNGMPWDEEEDHIIISEIRECYRTAVEYGFVKDFLTKLVGKPIKLFGDEITRSEAEEMVEERIQALRKDLEESGEDPTIIDSMRETLKKQLYSIIEVQYKVVDRDRKD